MTPGLAQRYLERLGLSARPPPTASALVDLVGRHLHTIPFENLDVIAGLPAVLSQEAALHKIVTRRRGGFCYELNEAFAALLTHLGFTLRRIEARVWSVPRQSFGAPFDHLALVVSLPDGDFLADVGFGDNNRTPLRLPADLREDVSGTYTLAQESEDLWLLSRPDRPLYRMTLSAQPLSAFTARHHYQRTSPESIFTQGLICTRATPEGRVTLSGDRLIELDRGRRTETAVGNRDAALEHHFGIVKED